MMDTIFFVLALILIVGGIFFVVSDAGLVLGSIVVSMTRWIQRVVFGIDQPRAGTESIIGRNVSIQSPFVRDDESGDVKGTVLVDGEVWQARSNASIDELKMCNDVKIVSRHGTELSVEPRTVQDPS